MNTQITVKELLDLCKIEIGNGNGDKHIVLSDDNEGNGYHGMFYGFTNYSEMFKEEIYIAARMAEKNALLIANQDEILKYLTTVMRGEEKDERVVIDGFGKATKATVRTQWNQIKAAELLAKRYGLLNEKLNIEGAVPVVICGEDDLEN